MTCKSKQFRMFFDYVYLTKIKWFENGSFAGSTKPKEIDCCVSLNQLNGKSFQSFKPLSLSLWWFYIS